jgi:hypothetical protein
LIRDNDICYAPFLFSILFDFTGHAGRHETHHVFDPLFFKTWRRKIGTTSTDWPFRFSIGTTELTSRADIEACPTSPAVLRLDVEWSPYTPFLTPTAKPDSLGHHLLFTHSNTETTKDTVFIFLPKSLLPDPIGRSQILNRFGLGVGAQQKLKDHSASFNDPVRCCTHMKSLFDWIST